MWRVTWLLHQEASTSFVHSINDSVAVNKYLKILIALWSCNARERQRLHIAQAKPCFLSQFVAERTAALTNKIESGALKSILYERSETYSLCCAFYIGIHINNAQIQTVIIIRIILCGFGGSPLEHKTILWKCTKAIFLVFMYTLNMYMLS